MISVWCLLLDYLNKPLVDILELSLEDIATISDLKKLIKKEVPIKLEDINSNFLTIWTCTDRNFTIDTNHKKRVAQVVDLFNNEGNVGQLDPRVKMAELHLAEEEILFVKVPPGPSTEELRNIYAKAWGRPWPHGTGKITNKDCGLKEVVLDEPTKMQVDDENNPSAVKGEPPKSRSQTVMANSTLLRVLDGMQIDGQSDSNAKDKQGTGKMKGSDEPISSATASKAPDFWDYTYIEDIEDLIDHLNLSFTQLESRESRIVVRDDYALLYDVLQNKARSLKKPRFVLTGQPGIGKTVFLLYLLLYRLERCLPTAIQGRPNKYILFDEHGVTIFGADQDSDRLSSMCWALCDSNVHTINPCMAYLSSHATVIQATSPREDRFKRWSTEYSAKTIIMDLPHPLEIAAIARENNINPTDAIAITQIWGPCTRYVVSDEPDAKLQAKADDAATLAAETPSILSSAGMPTSFASSLLFIRPVRFEKLGKYKFSAYKLEVPTPKLADILDAKRLKMTNANALKLFNFLSSHSLTREAVDWTHERNAHYHMSNNADPINLFPDGQMQPVINLLSGHLDALKSIEHINNFYWFPSITNLEGVDSVLGNENDVYVIHTMIALEYTCPKEGLRIVWSYIDSRAREKRWHYVVVTDSVKSAQEYRLQYHKGFHLGKDKIPVDVKACALPKQKY